MSSESISRQSDWTDSILRVMVAVAITFNSGGSETHVLWYFHQRSDWQIRVLLYLLKSGLKLVSRQVSGCGKLPHSGIPLNCLWNFNPPYKIVTSSTGYSDCWAMTVASVWSRNTSIFLLAVYSLKSPQSISKVGIEWEQQRNLTFFGNSLHEDQILSE